MLPANLAANSDDYSKRKQKMWMDSAYIFPQSLSRVWSTGKQMSRIVVGYFSVLAMSGIGNIGSYDIPTLNGVGLLRRITCITCTF